MTPSQAVNDHQHWSKRETVDGIHYVTLPSLVETFQTDPEPQEAFTDIRIVGNNIDIETFGLRPERSRLPVSYRS